VRAALLVALSVTALPAGASAAAPQPFGHACTDANGVRFCPTSSDVARVKSFDGVPLDVDVTLPPTGDGPFPTIVMLHGYGRNKTNFEQSKADGDAQPSDAPSSATLYHWNNVHFAQRGYAVVNYSARGFGRSCGSTDSRADPGCAKGWIHLGDQRFEARDTQHLLGLLVDQGVSRAGALGVTGISYGGGQSLELAYLRNRVRNLDGSFAEWKSPNGTSLSIAAAYPRWPWSDLVDALQPNGRYLDFRDSGPAESRDPIGVSIQSYNAGLYALGASTGFYSPPGADADADLTTWFARVNAGEPYGDDARAIVDELHDHHQGFGLPGTPAPLLIQNGWTDDLFPSSEALRVYNALRAGNPNAPVALQFGDLGHARGSNKANSDRAFNDQGTAFFDATLRATGSAPPAGSVTAFTQTCPQGAPAGGPFRAASWQEIHPGAVVFTSGSDQQISSGGGNPQTAQGLDPISGGGDACKDFADEAASGTAVYRGPESLGFTLLGQPTVTAAIETTGANGQIAARLWDIAPGGRQVLASRGVYRLRDDEKGTVTFQLHGGGYRFPAGHTPKLELLGRDAPTLRASNGNFTVKVSRLAVSLPVAERPGTTSQIVSPNPALLAVPGLRRARLSVRLRISKRVLTTRGRLVLPKGVTRARGCRGRVNVLVMARRRPLASRRLSVGHASCRFVSRVRLRSARLHGARRLTVTVLFNGNTALRPAALRGRHVRVRG
jgi:X-Pro dipeptidyl-peptidase (S15 family)